MCLFCIDFFWKFGIKYLEQVERCVDFLGSADVLVYCSEWLGANDQ